METLLPRLIEDCKFAVPTVFTFQQDGAPALAGYVLIFLLIFLLFAIEYLNIYNFEAVKIFQKNFQRFLIYLSPINPEILIKISLWVVEKLHFVRWDIFLGHPVYIYCIYIYIYIYK